MNKRFIQLKQLEKREPLEEQMFKEIALEQNNETNKLFPNQIINGANKIFR